VPPETKKADSDSDMGFPRFFKIAMRPTYKIHAIIDLIINLKFASNEDAEILKKN